MVNVREKAAPFCLFDIEEQGRQIARARLYIIHNDLHVRPYGLLEDVFVVEDRRGGPHGREIVQAVIEEARSLGCYKLIATSRTEREGLHRYYEELGFSKHGFAFRMDFPQNGQSSS